MENLEIKSTIKASKEETAKALAIIFSNPSLEKEFMRLTVKGLDTLMNSVMSMSTQVSLVAEQSIDSKSENAMLKAELRSLKKENKKLNDLVQKLKAK
jgi:DNA/RNA-binding domain of Phe-tRNA-synthetase-like protein